MKILIKFPTRSRPEKFLSTLQGYIDNTVGVATVDYLITCDSDDPTMNADVIKRIQDMTDRATINHGSSTSKIHAINRGMSQYKEPWDIVVLASDDMICVQHGWDQIIADTMAYHFPDTDGGLWFWDGDHQTRRNGLCTMNIMGRKYYERFGYLYHPSYISLWCDNEYTEVGKRLNKLPFFDQVLFKHVHFSNTPGLAPDELMRKTQSYFKQDMVNYHNRHAKGFDLHEVNR